MSTPAESAALLTTAANILAIGMRDADIAEQVAREPDAIASADTPRGDAARALAFIAEHLHAPGEAEQVLRDALGLTVEQKQHKHIGAAKCSCGFDAYKVQGIMLDYHQMTLGHFRAVRRGLIPTGWRAVGPWQEPTR